MRIVDDSDTYSWAIQQASALRRHAAEELDWDGLAEELDALGGSEENELYSRLVILLQHLLKWRFQANRRSRSWEASIAEQRLRIARRLKKSPGLKPILPEAFTDAYIVARLRALAETSLPDSGIPLSPPFALEQALDPGWFPQ